MPILMLTAADRLDDKATGFELGADDYLTKPFELRELVLRLRALDRRRAHNRPPVREIAGLRLDPFRREVYRDGRYVALTRKQFAVLEVLVAAEGGVVSAEELLERAWDENADPFTNAVRITVSALRKRLGEPWIIATVAGAGYRIDTRPDSGREGGDVDRAPGLSVRLKLTLSYAGFLMLAGVLMLAAVWAVVLRYIPDGVALRHASLVVVPFQPLRPPARLRLDRGHRAGVPAGIRSAGRLDSRRPHARPAGPHHRGHTHGRDRIALPPNPAGRPQRRVPRTRRQLRHHARAARSTRRRTAEIRSQRLPRTAHPAGDHADTSRRGPQRSRTATPASSSTASTPSTPERSTSPKRCSCSAAPTTILHLRTHRPVPHSGRSHRNAAPARRRTRPHHRNLRRHDPHHRLTRAPAAADHEPRAERDRPQPARTRRRVGHDQRSPQERGAHRREHRREAHPTVVPRLSSRFVAAPNAYAPTTQAWASAWQSSRASPRHTTEPSPSPPGRGGLGRHGATTRRSSGAGQEDDAQVLTIPRNISVTGGPRMRRNAARHGSRRAARSPVDA